MEAIRLRCGFLNVMPSMRSAKGKLGLRELDRFQLVCACWALSRREALVAEVHPVTDREEAPAVPKGRKRAAAEAAANAAAEVTAEVGIDEVGSGKVDVP